MERQVQVLRPTQGLILILSREVGAWGVGGLPNFCCITEGREGLEARDQEGVRRLPFYSWFCNELALCPWADQFLSLTLSFLLFYDQMQNLQGFPFQF